MKTPWGALNIEICLKITFWEQRVRSVTLRGQQCRDGVVNKGGRYAQLALEPSHLVKLDHHWNIRFHCIFWRDFELLNEAFPHNKFVDVNGDLQEFNDTATEAELAFPRTADKGHDFEGLWSIHLLGNDFSEREYKRPT